MTTNTYFLREENTVADMAYLDGEAARPMYDCMADLIIQNNGQNIVDVGCRNGRINRSLISKGHIDYAYYGFDTSSEPLEDATAEFAQYPRIMFGRGSWDDPLMIKRVDTLILSGVLIYSPNPHMMFETLVDHYRPSKVIVQEVSPTEDNPYNLKFTDMSFVMDRATATNISVDIPYGERTIYDVTI